jgi:hypothetical protein
MTLSPHDIRRLPSVHCAFLATSPTPLLPDQVEILCSLVRHSRPTSRGTGQRVEKELYSAAAWLLNCILFAVETIPSAWLVVPKTTAEYSPKGILRGRVGYRVVVQRLLPALRQAGWIIEIEGQFGGYGEGATTRVAAAGELLAAIRQCMYRWLPLEPPASDSIILRGMDKRLMPLPFTDQVAVWRVNLDRINRFLLEHSICLWLQDERLMSIATNMGDPNDSNPFDGLINFRSVSLGRIFGRGSLDKGGRFYWGWWQNIPGAYRRHIVVNGLPTTECDYSGMALRLLYAREGKDLGNADPYDIGLSDDSTGTRRKIVKQFVNAILNDERGTFRLSADEYAVLSLTPQELDRRVKARHHVIEHYFGTGVGMSLQFEDSCIAEKVMLGMMDGYNAVVMPVHDSFLVRSDYVDALQDEMERAFREYTGVSSRVTIERSMPDPDAHVHVKDGVVGVIENVDELTKRYSIAYTYTQTNPLADLYR